MTRYPAISLPATGRLGTIQSTVTLRAAGSANARLSIHLVRHRLVLCRRISDIVCLRRRPVHPARVDCWGRALRTPLDSPRSSPSGRRRLGAVTQCQFVRRLPSASRRRRRRTERTQRRSGRTRALCAGNTHRVPEIVRKTEIEPSFLSDSRDARRVSIRHFDGPSSGHDQRLRSLAPATSLRQWRIAAPCQFDHQSSSF